MSKEKEPETTWERVSNLSLPNQVRVLCDCIDEVKNAESEREPEAEPKPPKK